jgi:hypothetical protein
VPPPIRRSLVVADGDDVHPRLRPVGPLDVAPPAVGALEGLLRRIRGRIDAADGEGERTDDPRMGAAIEGFEVRVSHGSRRPVQRQMRREEAHTGTERERDENV